MNCAWDMVLNLVPISMRKTVDKFSADLVQELRLRSGQKAELIVKNKSIWLEHTVLKEDVQFCVNIASRYSPGSSATSSYGYITSAGGHRLGLCGQAVINNGKMTGFRSITSICIRVARDIREIAQDAAAFDGSYLILGRPGSGKTTLLRDLIRYLSQDNNVAVVDEREELFPILNGSHCFSTGRKMDIIYGCSKTSGIEMMLRTMNPDYIAIDEVTAEEDCNGLLHAGWCGVKLIATAHADSKYDLFKRPIYRPLVESGLFNNLLILQPDKSWRWERMSQCC